VPVEFLGFSDVAIAVTAVIYRGSLADPNDPNNNLLSVLTYEPEPQVTIGPDDVVAIQMVPGGIGNRLFISIRGFYQQQPA